jgi:hypothetical protein
MVFAPALALYAATADRGVQWQDSGWEQFRIITGNMAHPLGLVLVHPLQYYLGRAAVRCMPIEPAFAITLGVSCLPAAMAIANLAATVLVITRRQSAAIIAATAFALSHTFWQHATHTESYAIVTALLTGEWLCLALYVTTNRNRFLVLLAFLNGLGIADHMLAALATPVDVAVVISAARSGRLSRPQALAAAVLWLAGTLPYSTLVAGMLVRTGDLSGTVHSALFGTYAGDVLNVHLGLRTIVLVFGYVFYNFPGLTIPIAIYALIRPIDVPRVFSRAMRWELLIYTLFVGRYTITDQYTFLFPVYAILTIFSGIGMARIIAARASLRRNVTIGLAVLTVVWAPFIYAAATSVLSARKTFAGMVRNKPYRDGYKALFLPWGVAQDFAPILNSHAYRLAGDSGLILYEDSMVEFGLRYPQAVGKASTRVMVMPIESIAAPEVVAKRRSLLESYLSTGRRVVLVPRDRDRPETCVPEARWQRDGDLYVLTEISAKTH